MDVVERKVKFLKQLAGQPALELLEYLPDTYFFAKDLEGRFMAANAAFVKGTGLGSESELIGKSDLDVWPRHLAEGYRRDDRRVMQSGKAIINKLELSKNPKGGTDWFCTTKIPLRDKDGTVRGVAGFARDVKKSHSSFKPYMEMSKVIEYILSNYSSALSLKSLAAKAAMSPSQFERRFKKNLPVPGRKRSFHFPDRLPDRALRSQPFQPLLFHVHGPVGHPVPGRAFGGQKPLTFYSGEADWKRA
jgi:PAS domain S-box-containing protein